MSILVLILQLLPSVLTIVRQVEEIVQGARQGQVKRELAVGVLNQSLDLATQAGALKPVDADRAKALTGPLVDLTVGVLNATGVFRSSQPASESP